MKWMKKKEKNGYGKMLLLYEVILDMAVKHLPNPIEAQKYRIPKIWHGDIETEFGKGFINCDPKGKIAFVITRIVIDPRIRKRSFCRKIIFRNIKKWNGSLS